jgi:hypothetical protein
LQTKPVSKEFWQSQIGEELAPYVEKEIILLMNIYRTHGNQLFFKYTWVVMSGYRLDTPLGFGALASRIAHEERRIMLEAASNPSKTLKVLLLPLMLFLGLIRADSVMAQHPMPSPTFELTVTSKTTRHPNQNPQMTIEPLNARPNSTPGLNGTLIQRTSRNVKGVTITTELRKLDGRLAPFLTFVIALAAPVLGASTATLLAAGIHQFLNTGLRTPQIVYRFRAWRRARRIKPQLLGLVDSAHAATAPGQASTKKFEGFDLNGLLPGADDLKPVRDTLLGAAAQAIGSAA